MVFIRVYYISSSREINEPRALAKLSSGKNSRKNGVCIDKSTYLIVEKMGGKTDPIHVLTQFTMISLDECLG